MKYLLSFLILLCFGFSCQPGKTSPENASIDSNPLNQDSLFRMEPIPASSYRIAQKKGKNEEILEEGITDAKGLKNGMWVIYQGEGRYPAKIANYVNGLYNGPYFEFDGFGRMAVSANYLNNKLHGLLVKFDSGNLAQESAYKNGVLDGTYKEYNRSGWVQKEINYKNGQLDGSFRYYDKEGKVTLEYLYKNGKQQ